VSSARSNRIHHTGWAAPYATTKGLLAEIQQGLPVRLITTPRNLLKTCYSDDLLVEVVERNVERFDFLPVVDGGSKVASDIVGLLETTTVDPSRSSSRRVSESMTRLTERNLIGADASIFSFLESADDRPCRLVVSGSVIEGLVTLSDLQKLPVRAALFSLITHLEMTMAAAIRRDCSEIEEWRARLSPGRREKIEGKQQAAKSDDSWVDDLLFTEFCDKVTIIKASGRFGRSKRSFEDEMSRIRDLRDSLAHANDYAASRDAAKGTCRTVRIIEKWIDDLDAWLPPTGERSVGS
jgi:hypothetical protein